MPDQDARPRDGGECPRCGNQLEDSPADDADEECGYCGFYVYEPADVDLPPCWRREPDRADKLGLSRLFTHIDKPGFIAVRGSTVELVRADMLAGETPDPEQVDVEGREERAEAIRSLAEKYNDEVFATDGGTERPGDGEQQSKTPTKKVGFSEYDDDIENYGYCLKCSEWSFAPDQNQCPECSAKNRFRTGKAAKPYFPDHA